MSPRPAAAFALAVFLAAPAWGWGGKMHEIINRRAAEAVEGPAAAAWGPMGRTLGAHASDADHRKSSDSAEPPRHFLDADAWDSPPFDDVPRTLDGMFRRHGREATLRFGIVPWAIEECYRMVVLSLRGGDWASAAAWAADLGHYVADSHEPLHCTLNYDGQRTGNDGVHLRFEVAMMDRNFREDSIGPFRIRPHPGGSPVERCFSWIAEAYPGLEPILRADTLARSRDPDFGDAYYEVLWNESSGVAVLQMQRSVEDLAALYAAAWEEAGRPAPPEVLPTPRARTLAELEDAPAGSRRTARGALLVAGAAILGVLALGGR